jgi:2-hydroxy-3-keto-5-methylthiopentenyl-1-phosphate phosphatase
VSRARRIPERVAQGLPLAFLVDFDGTIARTDVQEMLLVEHSTDPAWRERDNDYLAGRAGSRALIDYNLRVLQHDPALLRATADAQPHDETFPDFAHWVQQHGARLEVVSDGLGFYVHDCLTRMGLPDVPVATNEFDPDREPWSASFPYGHPDCFVCGTCKRERVRSHQAAGWLVLFVGDGASDYYAAAHADVIFAKHRLAEVCRAEGWPWVAWDVFADVVAWTEQALSQGSLPGSPEAVGPWREACYPGGRPFVCGPEVWGDGRRNPTLLVGGRSHRPREGEK